ncbi:MAG: patatin-like phospholipase family protein [Cytophagaceae bacterium]|nr:MAG: patatin-like phospholipase family protein [Cytophagaceae bacterium]
MPIILVNKRNSKNRKIVVMHIDEDLKQYQAILLSGCAVLGAAHLGFLLTLEAERKLRFLKVVTGASIGSIVGLFYLAAIPLDAVAAIFRDHTLLSMLTLLDDMQEMYQQQGLFNPTKIIAVCKDICRRHGVEPDTLTFKALRQTGRPVDLVIVASRYDTLNHTFSPDYFSIETSPDMLVFDAIRLSISIPLVFAVPTYLDAYYVDGVLTDELPFAYIEQKYAIKTDDMLAHAPYSDNHTSSSMYTHLVKHCLTQVRKPTAPHRVLHTKLILPHIASELTTTPELIDYFIISGIITTRTFLSS